jgi:hypothetical protein
MSKRKDESRPYGAGNTFWYINDEGDVIICKYNDAAWCSNHSQVNIKEMSEWRLLKLIDDAYQRGRAEQQIIIKNALGV